MRRTMPMPQGKHEAPDCSDGLSRRSREVQATPQSILSLSFLVYVGGIYACFMTCSLLHESIYRARDSSGAALSPWFVNVIESTANVIVAGLGMHFWEGRQPFVPQWGMAKTGCLQVVAKYCASSSRLYGVSAPMLTLVKSARPLPVMLGQRLIAGVTYTQREYCQYVLVVVASVLVGAARSPLPSDDLSVAGLLFLLASTLCDGYVGGRQKEMKTTVRAYRRSQRQPVEDLQPFELQFFTNLYMLATASVFVLSSGDCWSGVRFMATVPDVQLQLCQYAICSSVGQIFIFACVTQFDPLVLAVVTTSRKFISVLATLVVFEYEVGATSFAGLLLAGVGFYLIVTGEIKRASHKDVAFLKIDTHAVDAGFDDHEATVRNRPRPELVERNSPKSSSAS